MIVSSKGREAPDVPIKKKGSPKDSEKEVASDAGKVVVEFDGIKAWALCTQDADKHVAFDEEKEVDDVQKIDGLEVQAAYAQNQDKYVVHSQKYNQKSVSPRKSQTRFWIAGAIIGIIVIVAAIAGAILGLRQQKDARAGGTVRGPLSAAPSSSATSTSRAILPSVIPNRRNIAALAYMNGSTAST